MDVAERLVVRSRTGVVTPCDLPPEISDSPRSDAQPAFPHSARPDAASVPDVERLFKDMVEGGGSFWSVVYAPFMARDLTRQDLRGIIGRGLQLTRGNYKALAKAFNLPEEDYKRLLNFLRKYECQMPFQQFRSAAVRPSAGGMDPNSERLRRQG